MRKYIVIGVAAIVVLSIAVWALSRCKVCDATNYPPSGQTIVAFGDSLVEGVGSERGGGFVSILSDRLGIPITNLGVSGNTTAQGLQRIGEVIELDPDITIVVLGGNDVIKKVPQTETFANLEEIVTQLHEQGSIVIIVGVRTGIFSKRYDDSYEQLSKRNGAIYLEDALKGLFGKSEYMADPIHPNDTGYARLADRFEPLVRELLMTE